MNPSRTKSFWAEFIVGVIAFLVVRTLLVVFFDLSTMAEWAITFAVLFVVVFPVYNYFTKVRRSSAR